MPTQRDFEVPSLGPCTVLSPIVLEPGSSYTSDSRRVRLDPEIDLDAPSRSDGTELTLELAGPRERIFFEPSRTTAAIVTCGGLSPGLNNVIRSAYFELAYNYGVPRVLGIRDGYMGLNPDVGAKPIELTKEAVVEIHNKGGTMLGSSRGPQDPKVVVDFLVDQQIDLLFCIGGDGTQRGAHVIAEEVSRRGLSKSIIGIPKTIDNDVPFVWMTFGFITALEVAEVVLRAAHTEAWGAPNGIGVVKLMGRDAGYIAAGAAAASQDANFVLVPEVAFEMEGDNGLLAALEQRIRRRGHAMIVVAEGAGQHLFQQGSDQRDASGNVRHVDIGPYLCDRIKKHFATREIQINLKYLDPSYAIRGVPANAWDRILSDQMARYAVHAGMAGKTDMLVGRESQRWVHVPITTSSSERKRLSPTDNLWQAVLSSTGQPHW